MDINKVKKDYEVLYESMFSPLFRYVYFRTKNKQIAEDITQESFLKFLKQGYKEREYLHNKKILFVISRNLLIDFYRKKAFRKEESLDVLNIDVSFSGPDPEEDYVNTERRYELKEIMNVLSDAEEDVVLLRNTSNMNYKEISEVLEISEENARQIYSRSIRKMSDYAKLKNIKYD